MIRVRSNAFGEGDHGQVRRRARAFARSRLRGRSWINAHTGWRIGVSNETVGKIISNSGDIRRVHLLAVLPQLIQAGTLEISEPAIDKHRSVFAYHRFETIVEYDGRREPVHFVVRQDTSGHFYLNHDYGRVQK